MGKHQILFRLAPGPLAFMQIPGLNLLGYFEPAWCPLASGGLPAMGHRNLAGALKVTFHRRNLPLPETPETTYCHTGGKINRVFRN